MTLPPPIHDYPLGAEPSGSAHSVVCAFPRLADVHGYAQRKPETMQAIRIGYPRFFRNPSLDDLIRRYRADGAVLPDEFCYPLHPGTHIPGLVPSEIPHRIVQTEERGIILALPAHTPEVPRRQVEKQIRSQGCVLCSRSAAAILDGAVSRQPPGCRTLREFAEIMNADPTNLFFSNSGMSAFYAAFRAINDIQHPQGRNRWLQLGWLYVDSGEILATSVNESGNIVDIIWDVHDRASIEAWFETHEKEVAGVVVEVPSNPLLQVVDLPWLAEMTRRKGGLLLADPSTSSVLNINVLPWCDLLVSSLTKYTGWSGDLMLGLCAINPASSQAGALCQSLARHNLSASAESLLRLETLWPESAEQTRVMSTNAARLARFLKEHPSVDTVWYPEFESDAPRYSMLRENTSVRGGGGMVTFTLKGSLKTFYDSIACFKGPSFGTYFTNVSPFIHLAHYDLATSEEGRMKLETAKIPPDLIRASIGCEPYEAIESTFRKALETR